MAHIPVARGLAVCEQVIVEEGTKNVTLVNCFTSKRVRRFPAGQLKMVVFAFLSDGLGEIHLRVMIQRLDNLDSIYERTQQLEFSDRMQEVRYFLRIENCRFPTAGNYQVSLLAENEVIAQQKFRLVATEN